MGILDELSGQIPHSGGSQHMLEAVMGMLSHSQGGGLSGLVQQFTGNGMGDIVNSWVGTGQNLPITAQQISHGMGNDTISRLAAQVGISPDLVTSHLSTLLPQIVDKLTPNGQIVQGDIMTSGMDLLRGFLK